MGKKLLSLSPEVEEKLEQEPNQSALVDVLLASYYGIELPRGDAHLEARHHLLSELIQGYDTEDEPDVSEKAFAVPLPANGKPLDAVVQPEKELKGTPNVTINYLGRPAIQTPEGLVHTDDKPDSDEWCAIHKTEKIAGLCLACL